MYVCVCMCVLLCRRTSINRWGTSNTNRTKENNVRHVVYLAIGKHNFYVLLTRMSRFEFRDYQQCWSFFFFFFLHSTFSCCSILAIRKDYEHVWQWNSREFIFFRGYREWKLSISFARFSFQKIELFFAEIFVDKFLFFLECQSYVNRQPNRESEN